MPASWNTDMDGKPSIIGGTLLVDKPLERAFPPEEGPDEWGKTAREQEEAVEELRQNLVKRESWNPDGPLDFSSLLRFLQARDYDIDRALNMVLDHMQWRQEERVDHILSEFTFTEREQFLAVYPQGYHQTDKLGHPIYIQHLGSVDLARIREVTEEDRMVKYHIQEYERCLEYIFPIVSKIHGRQIDKTFAIVDAKGIGLKHLTKDVREVLSKVMAIDQNNYPETLYHTCVINAPAAFRVIWGVVKPMLNARTQAKIEVCPKNFLPALKKWIDEENIPEYLGGKSKGTLVDDVGPWKNPELVEEIEAERERKCKRRIPDTGLTLATGDLVQRQLSSLSSASLYEDALSSPHFRDSPPGQKGHEHLEFSEAGKLLSDSPGPPEVLPKENRSLGLQARIQDLEAMFDQQYSRLQPHTSRYSFPKATPRDTTTLLGRVEVLERGMDLLLRAQDDQWSKAPAGQPSSKSCHCCSIM